MAYGDSGTVERGDTTHRGSTYRHYVKRAARDPEFDRDMQFVMCESLDHLDDSLWKYEDDMAVDTETVSLYYDRGVVVGFSFAHAAEPKVGYYAPINHLGYEQFNLDYDEALARLDARISDLPKGVATYYYNYMFDMTMLEYQGLNLDPYRYGCKYLDVMSAVWLLDTNKRMPALKWSLDYFLGWKTLEFSDVTDGSRNFQVMDPRGSATRYAASDAIGTMLLAQRVVPVVVQECPRILKIDNDMLYPLAQWMRQKIDFDTHKLAEIQMALEDEMMNLVARLGAEAGGRRVFSGTKDEKKAQNGGKPLNWDKGHFDVESSAHVAKLFAEKGISTGVPTDKTKNLPPHQQRMSTSADALEKIKDRTPLAGLIMDIRQKSKSNGTYVKPIQRSCQIGANRFSYKGHASATGRLSGATDKPTAEEKREGRLYFSGVNIQSIPKPHSLFYVECPQGAEHYDTEILGNRLLSIKKADLSSGIYERKIEGMDPERNVRDTFIAPEDYWWFSADYSGEELRLAANLSGETAMIQAYLDGEDIHSKTCIALFGKHNSDLRKKAKIFNFAVIYGATAWTLSKQLGISEAEAEDLLRKFNRAYPKMFMFIKELKSQARMRGMVTTFLGRPRRLRHWYAQGGFAAKSAGDRRAFNSIIQGTAADVLRMGLTRIWREVYQDYRGTDDLLFRSTVHDEVNFIVRKEKFGEIVPRILNCLKFHPKQWPIPLIVSQEIGTSWGNLFPHVYNYETGEFALDSEPLEERDFADAA